MSPLKKFLNNFWKDGLSIDESKVSVLILVLLLTFAVSGYLAIKQGDLPANYLNLLTTLILVIGGVNGIESIFKNRTKQDESE